LFVTACSDDGPDVPDELKGVCTQADKAATDTIQVERPKAGEKITSPLTFSGKVRVEEPILYLSIVAADGTHIADYPARPSETGTTAPFQQAVPFGVGEETPACLWVSHTNEQDPAGAIRIPVNLIPGGTR
jgi:hypothetical protein